MDAPLHVPLEASVSATLGCDARSTRLGLRSLSLSARSADNRLRARCVLVGGAAEDAVQTLNPAHGRATGRLGGCSSASHRALGGGGGLLALTAEPRVRGLPLGGLSLAVAASGALFGGAEEGLSDGWPCAFAQVTVRPAGRVALGVAASATAEAAGGPSRARALHQTTLTACACAVLRDTLTLGGWLSAARSRTGRLPAGLEWAATLAPAPHAPGFRWGCVLGQGLASGKLQGEAFLHCGPPSGGWAVVPAVVCEGGRAEGRLALQLGF